MNSKLLVFTDFSGQSDLDLSRTRLIQMGSVSFWPVPVIFKEHLFNHWHKMFEAHCVPFLLQLWGQSVLPEESVQKSNGQSQFFLGLSSGECG